MDNRILWEPDQNFINSSVTEKFIDFIYNKKKIKFKDYDSLHKYSITNVKEFWPQLAEFFNINLGKYTSVITGSNVNSRWFNGSSINYSEYVYRNKDIEKTAIEFLDESGNHGKISYKQLWERVSSLAFFFKEKGIKKGDVVAAYISNIPEAVISFLASASIGAVFSSCSPDFGIKGVIARFSQIKPSILIVSSEYPYGGKIYDRTDLCSDIYKSLTSLKVAITTGERKIPGFINFNDINYNKTFIPENVDFSHPLWILFSSGTTGKPKAIVHGHGGILLEHFKLLGMHMNITDKDKFLWYTTTGWMMWNVLVSGLIIKSTIFLYNGSPAYPDQDRLWNIVNKYNISHFGTSAAYIESCMKDNLKLKDRYKFTDLNFIGSTGSPLSPAGFDYIYNNAKSNVWLSSLSGGTDICSAVCAGSPILPVYEGEIQCRALGVDVESFNDSGKAIYDKPGEMVILNSIPSMPLFFWNDKNNERYYKSYYSFYKNIWRHGDYIEINDHGGIIIYGRSDGVLNRNGIRIGTAEIYSVIDTFEEILDSIATGIELPDNLYMFILFVKLKDGSTLDVELKNNIKMRLRKDLSPRHVPDFIYQINDIPVTLNGKKLELPVKKILLGNNPDEVINKSSVKNPESLQYFVEMSLKIKDNYIKK